jgi:hypothetical protein
MSNSYTILFPKEKNIVLPNVCICCGEELQEKGKKKIHFISVNLPSAENKVRTPLCKICSDSCHHDGVKYLRLFTRSFLLVGIILILLLIKIVFQIEVSYNKIGMLFVIFLGVPIIIEILDTFSSFFIYIPFSNFFRKQEKNLFPVGEHTNWVRKYKRLKTNVKIYFYGGIIIVFLPSIFIMKIFDFSIFESILASAIAAAVFGIICNIISSIIEILFVFFMSKKEKYNFIKNKIEIVPSETEREYKFNFSNKKYASQFGIANGIIKKELD